jgi:eukaryotic-like serine/threonine-protein kinase
MVVQAGLLPDRYSNPQPIGRGGMGEIFRATDTTLGRAVAIKVLDQRFAQDEAVRQRFTREALAVARLSGNPHTVTIYDVGERAARPFIVMEYLAGGSLQDRLDREGAQQPGQALEWLGQAAAALDAAHRSGIVHRDIKPANLLLDQRGSVHVADFGIASAAGLDSLTQTGTVLGTASYLSPEQAQGGRTTPASDLYSLAVVAFELLTGRRPFEGGSAAAEAAAHVTGEVPSVRDVNSNLPRELDPVFARALAKDPADRYGSCAEFVANLRASLDEAAGATSVIAARPAPAPRPRRLAPLLLGLVALVLVGAGASYALFGGSDPKPAAVSVRTVTQPGTTIVSTQVTTVPAAPTTTAAPPAGVGGDPVDENNRAFALMQSGDYASALPLLEDAVAQFGDRSDLPAAYANYNLGFTLMQLGRCDEGLPYLERSRELQPDRREVKDAIKLARKC